MTDTAGEFEARRDPDAILKQIEEAEAAEGDTRGKLKVFFGYAAGVGKTYAMLEEAHAVLEKGFDVVVGYIEPHTRADTMALVEGLEQIPPLEVKHRGIVLREFDLDAVLERRPQIVLVDEFAHSNAPSSRHRKRYQDVEELLRAGINVFTTVNVQHLEGLNDKIAAITHVTVAERIPDRVFDEAASVELVDIEPDDLIERLEAGKIYLPDRARTALGNFFSQKNLAALREIALRRMADRLTRRAESTSAGRRVEAGEDVLVYVTHDPGNVKAVRAAANMAESYHGTFTAVVVESSQSKRFDNAQRGRLRANIDLAEELGAHVVTLFGDDIAQQIAQYAETAGVTHIVVGNATGLRTLALGREGLVNRLVRLVHGAVVDVVPTKDLPAQYGRLREAQGLHPTMGDVWKALAAAAIATAVGMVIYELGLSGSVILVLYLIVALLIATRADGFFYAVVVALASTVAYNFFFTVPRFTFNAYGINYPFIFGFLLVGTLVASSLAVRMKRQAEATARRAYRMEVLLESSRKLQGAKDVDACFRLTAEQIIKLLNRPVVMYRLDDAGRLLTPEVHDAPGTEGGDASSAALVSPSEAAVAAWVASNNERAGATTDTLVDARCLYLPIRSKGAVFGVAGIVMDEGEDDDFGAFEKNLLLMIIDECGQTSEQIAFADERRRMELRVEKETLRSNLLRTISHDLRTPLTSISGDADMLLHSEEALEPDLRRRMYRDIHDDARWLITLVENLLSITRIDNGTMQLAVQPELVADIVHEALQHVDRRAATRQVVVELEDELLMVNVDARLIVQVVINLVNNAIAYTPSEGRIGVTARRAGTALDPLVRIAVTDEGPGVSEEDRGHLFDMFYNGSTGKPGGKSGDFKRGMGLGLSLCRSIVEVHGGSIGARNVDPHGSEFWFTLPAVEVVDVVGEAMKKESCG
ncbi:sensor histidine kinase [Arabiibacter massiliensis]|uniref:sensor histidine kinase n=1 Tax=Arabiibacter massiliensis TaxID=1870985 RepID=UPI0009B966B3|nr:sensor histidine kinase KdpD [Arabiibacter massiliensis]